MNQISGYLKEKLHMSVCKAIFVRRSDRVDGGDTWFKLRYRKDGFKPRYRVVHNHFYSPLETDYVLTLKNADGSKKSMWFNLRVDNEMYYRSETQVCVYDFDTGDSLSFGDRVTLGLLPEELFNIMQTRQEKRLLDEKQKEGFNNWLLIACLGIGVLAFVCGLFAGVVFYPSLAGGSSAVVPVVTP